MTGETRKLQVEQDDPVELVPLVSDLDGTLVKTDLLAESALILMKRGPWYLIMMFFWFVRGGSPRLKAEIADRVVLDADSLPLQTGFVEFLRAEAARGRKVYLATASNRRFAELIFCRLGFFTDFLAGDRHHNLKGQQKVDRIRALLGSRPFDYAGDSYADLSVWARARQAILVNPVPGLKSIAQRRFNVQRVFDDQPSSKVFTWLRAVRLYQWGKNLLVGVPILTAHTFDTKSLSATLVGFISFGCVASATYLLNDLFDLVSDRHHPRKCKRAFAAGDISITAGMVGILCLLTAGLVLSVMLSPAFLAVILAYLMLTVSYSLFLKRFILIDALLLAALYTARIIAGAMAIHVTVSSWLLAFSIFVFLSLALVKRCSELLAMKKIGRAGASDKDYAVSDYNVLSAMGIAAGYVSVLVLALFVDTPEVYTHYSRPKLLWLLCPFMLYWVSRLWMKTGRGEMKDDPLLFSLKDSASWITFIGMALATLAAI